MRWHFVARSALIALISTFLFLGGQPRGLAGEPHGPVRGDVDLGEEKAGRCDDSAACIGDRHRTGRKISMLGGHANGAPDGPCRSVRSALSHLRDDDSPDAEAAGAGACSPAMGMAALGSMR